MHVQHDICLPPLPLPFELQCTRMHKKLKESLEKGEMQWKTIWLNEVCVLHNLLTTMNCAAGNTLQMFLNSLDLLKGLMGMMQPIFLSACVSV